MKTFSIVTKAGLAAMAFAALFAGQAQANCRLNPTARMRSHRPALLTLPVKHEAQPLQPADISAATPAPSVAGMWYVQFIADGQVVDDGFDTWHSDGTEVLNDTSTILSGNICFGVWTQTGTYTYTLKHPTWTYDDAGVNVIGVGIIREDITLDIDGNGYSGLATIDAYDLAGNPVFHETARLLAKRINAIDDPGHTTGIPGLPTLILNR